MQDRSAKGPRTGRPGSAPAIAAGQEVGGQTAPPVARAANPPPRPREREETHGGFVKAAGVFLSRLLMLVVPLVVLTALALGLGYVRLRHGPVTLKVLARPIERGIAAELPGMTAKIDDVVVKLGDDGSLKFQLSNLRLREADGDPVASAPQAAVELSGAALRAGRIVPSRVEFIEPTVSLTLGDDGRLALSFAHVADDGQPGGGQTHRQCTAPRRAVAGAGLWRAAVSGRGVLAAPYRCRPHACGGDRASPPSASMPPPTCARSACAMRRCCSTMPDAARSGACSKWPSTWSTAPSAA